ncbi:unnamed protein product [Psylliodes chrysocephalus]|uniref:pyridoxal 5'-phosphate synthase n=1 Tax=Psylliodes chrysocephalus TaxID=3402493 RepID=A0A9P0GL87_9CUCU|nr:unnamed protein product [Psylliodes chrysocephala]
MGDVKSECDCEDEKEQWGDPEPAENSRLARIDLRPHHNTPYALYCDWLKDANNHGLTKFQTSQFSLATCSRCGELGNRMISLREFRNYMYIITISSFSKTYQHIKETRKATMLFFFQYWNYRGTYIRQIKIDCRCKRLCSGITELYHDKEPLSGKVKYEICSSGQLADWEALKKVHDRTVVKYRCGQNELKMPNHYVGYALIPHKYEFLHMEEGYIPDRVTYQKSCDCGWSIRRIMA